MLKISMLALCTVITSLLIKKQSPVTASVIGLSLCLIISINIINNISAITGQLGVMISLTGIGDVYIKIIMKIIGITFITQLISDVCRDNGFNAAASQLEIMCKIAVATISIPIVLSLMEMINKCNDKLLNNINGNFIRCNPCLSLCYIFNLSFLAVF